MPAAAAAVGVLVAGASSALAGLTTGFVSGWIVSLAAKAALGIGLSFLVGKLFAPEVPRAKGQSQVIRSSISPRQIVYGRTRKSGTLVFAKVTGNENQYLHMVIVLAGHPVQSFGAVYANGRPIIEFGYGADYAWKYTLYDGTQTAADPDLVAACDEWTEAHIGRGLAYIYIRLGYNTEVWQTGIPSIQVDIVEGKYDIWDPRTGVTGFTDNAALCRADYLLSDLGFGVPRERIDADLLAASAYLCDETLTVPGTAPRTLDDGASRTVDTSSTRVVTESENSGSHKRYTVNGVIDSTNQPIDVLEALAGSAAGPTIYDDGQFKIHCGAASVPVARMDESDLRGDVTIVGSTPRKDRINAVGGTFTSPDDNWQPTDFPRVSDEDLQRADGEVIARNVDLPFTIDPMTAQRLAWLELQQSKQRISLQWPANLDAIWLHPWETVLVSLERFGWVDKEFRILEKTVTGLGVDLVLREETASYDPPLSMYQIPEAPATLTPPASPTPPVPENLTGAITYYNLPLDVDVAVAISGGSGSETATATVISESRQLEARLSWDAVTSEFAIEYDLQWIETYSGNDWAIAGSTDGTEIVVTGLAYDVSYRFRVRSRYVASGKTSDWSDYIELVEWDWTA